MKSLTIQAAPEAKSEKVTVLNEVRAILSKLSESTLLSPEKTLQKLQETYPKASISKHPRKHKIDDSYIVSIPCGSGTISIKIHKDIFGKCRRVYENRLLLGDLVHDHVIPSILETYTTKGIRIVAYEWEIGEDPLTLMKNTQTKCRIKIERLLSQLLDSLGKKGCQISPHHPRPDEFLYTQRGALILLDPNRILRRKSVTSPVQQAREIVRTWLAQI